MPRRSYFLRLEGLVVGLASLGRRGFLHLARAARGCTAPCLLTAHRQATVALASCALTVSSAVSAFQLPLASQKLCQRWLW